MTYVTVGQKVRSRLNPDFLYEVTAQLSNHKVRVMVVEAIKPYQADLVVRNDRFDCDMDNLEPV